MICNGNELILEQPMSNHDFVTGKETL